VKGVETGAPPTARHGRAALTHGVISVAIPEEDIEAMDAMIVELKRRGVANASRAWLVRRMLADFNIDTVADPALRYWNLQRETRAQRIKRVALRTTKSRPRAKVPP